MNVISPATGTTHHRTSLACAAVAAFAVAAATVAVTQKGAGPRTLEEIADRAAASGLHVSTGSGQPTIGLAVYLSDHPLTSDDLAALRGYDAGGPSWRGVVLVTLARGGDMGPPRLAGERKAGPFLLAGDAELMQQVAELCH